MLPRRSRSRAPNRLSISFSWLFSRLFIAWETRAFNEFLFFWGQRLSRFLKIWFSVGIVFGVIMMITVFLMLLSVPSLFIRLGSQKSAIGNAEQSRELITFVVPGVNVPWSDLPYMIFATTSAVGFHELGHALAVTSEGVHIEYIALFMACLVPGAFIAFSDDCLQCLPPMCALRVYCAGIWHNYLLCAGCYLLSMLLPVVLCPFYLLGKNPLVIDVPTTSALAGHLRPGDSILELAGLKIQSPEDWSQSLHTLHFKEIERDSSALAANNLKNDSIWASSHSVATQGFCVPTDSLDNQGSSPGIVCSGNKLMFLERPCRSGNSSKQKLKTQSKKSQNAFCLRATDVMQHLSCTKMHRPEMASNSCPCSENEVCLLPVLPDGEALIQIKIKYSSSDVCSLEVMESKTASGCQQSVAFVGDPQMLVYSLHLTKYWPRKISFLGLFNISFWRWLPDALERLLTYITCISAAMAFVNSAPSLPGMILSDSSTWKHTVLLIMKGSCTQVFYLDGEAIVQGWLSLTSPYIHPRYRRRILNILLTVGSILLLLFLLCGLQKTITRA